MNLALRDIRHNVPRFALTALGLGGLLGIVVVTVGTDGRPTACRVQRASRDAAANAVTCRLAIQRFRFRAATDAAGNPVEAVYGWKQSWHY